MTKSSLVFPLRNTNVRREDTGTPFPMKTEGVYVVVTRPLLFVPKEGVS